MTEFEKGMLRSIEDIEEVARKLNAEWKEKGKDWIATSNLAPILGVTFDFLSAAIREGKFGPGAASRGENAKSWSTSSYIPLIYCWLGQYGFKDVAVNQKV